MGLAKGPMDGPVMAGFKAALESINELADTASGFVWRLQTEDGDATAIRPYEDERMMVNMSTCTVDEAKQRLEHLAQNGPTPYAFTFRASFPSPDSQARRVDDEIGCPA